ncbi:MAG: hypothetical protein IT432_16905 [Phycisphaerales bacterium]|nr:hypothetical protein [Phycisphaerales bacterium]
MAFTIIAAVLAGLASAATPPGEERVVDVARTGVARLRPDVVELVGSEIIEESVPEFAANMAGIPNYVCHEYAAGCPANTVKLDGSGNVIGCDEECVGEWTLCTGSIVAAFICLRSQNDECVLATGSVNCGKAADGVCYQTAPGAGDNQDCWCQYVQEQPLTLCKVRICAIGP